MRTEPPNHANRCLVVGSDGAPLMPCTVQRAAKLRKNGRAQPHSPEPCCIRILDQKASDPDVAAVETEVRVDPGARDTGERLKAVGHGRRKQIKGLPTGEYLAWRHEAPRVRRAVEAPRHAANPHTVHGIRTGDRVRITGRRGIATGRATVFAKESTTRARQHDGTCRSTTKKSAVQRIAGRCSYIR